MPDKVYLDDNGNPMSAKVYLDANGEPVAPAGPGAVSRFGTGVKEGLGGVVDMMRHPIDTITGFGSMLVDGAKAVPDVVRNLANSETRGATVQGFTEGAVEGATGLDVQTAKKDIPTALGKFVGGVVIPGIALKGAGAGVRAVKGSRLTSGGRAAHAAAAAQRAEMENVARGLGGATSQAEMEAVARGMAEGPKPVAGSRLAPKPLTPEEQMAKALEEVRADLAKADAPVSTELPPPPFSQGAPAPAAQPATSFPRQVAGNRRAPAPEPAPETGRLVPTPERPASAPPTANVNQAIAEALDELSAKPEASPRVEPAPAGTGMSGQGVAPEVPAAPPGGAPIQSLPGMGIDESTLSRFRESVDGGDLGDMRRAVGSEKATRSLDELAQELGVDPEVIQQMMRDTTDGPSRRPMAAELAEMDNDYLRRISDERGAVNPRLAMTIGAGAAGAAGGAAYFDENPLGGAVAGGLAGAAAVNPAAALKRVQELRMMGMLSGAALPKSVLGNIGAHLTAAAETGSMAPVKELLRLPTNARNAAAAFKSQPHNVSASTGSAPVEGLGRLNLPGRIMGAMDEASTASLQRAGRSTEDAQRLLLTTENPVGTGSTLNSTFNTPLGRAIVPFQRIPINGFSEGVMAAQGLATGGSHIPASRAQAYGSPRGRALTAGAVGAGAAAGATTDDPITLALIAALAGPRALPLAAGAGLTAGHRVLERVGVGLPDGNIRDVFDPLRPIDRPALMKFLAYLNGEQE